MDHFDRKRGMVKQLLEVLKRSAADEMAGHPHMTDLTQTNKLQQKTSDSSMMAEGGLAGTDMDAKDEPMRVTEPPVQNADGSANEEAIKNLPGPIEDEALEKDEAQALHNENIMDEDEDNNSSSFDAFLPRKKKK